MRFAKSAGLVAVLSIAALTAYTTVKADDAPKPAATAPSAAHKAAAKLGQPWNKLNLTAEQANTISDIRKATQEAIKKLQDDEKQKIDAVLTDDQRNELQRIHDQEKADREAKAHAAKEHNANGDKKPDGKP